MPPAKTLHVVLASWLGWTLDAFDFFIMVFLFSDVAASFGTSLTVITWALTATLAARPIGAFVFGRLADRLGRRPILMASVLGYSLLELASGFAPNLTVFLILRGLFGIAMGGEWGIGASLTMETVPLRWRGVVSGLLQAGYPTGYLLATLLYWQLYPIVGWRGMFVLGALPALLVLYIRRSVPESQEWVRERQSRVEKKTVWDVCTGHRGVMIYAVAMMVGFNFFSHGTQDLYPNAFLKLQHHFSHQIVSGIVIVSNIGAILGGLFFGALSQKIGRPISIAIASLASLFAVYPWAFGTTPGALGWAVFFMQFCVQGAWGVVPVYLNELSPAGIRATFPGVVYQLGNLIASANATIQSLIARELNGDYRIPLAGTAGLTALFLLVLVVFNRSRTERPG